jgi:large-conductance mechanosensitive channel
MSTTKPSNLQPFKRSHLLPLKNRPRKLLSKKKRPQSVLSPPSSSFQSGSGSVSAFLTSNPFALSQSSQSQSSLSLSSPPIPPIINDTTEAEKQQHKRSRVKANSSPVWQLGNDTSCLSDVPLFHIPPMTRLVVNMNDNTNKSKDGNSNSNRNKQGGRIYNYNSPNNIATRIVQYIESISGIGNYNSQLACATIRTMNQVILTIQLFKLADHENIVIEIERKEGDIIQFHWVANAIFRAVKGTEQKQEEEQTQEDEHVTTPCSFESNTHSSTHTTELQHPILTSKSICDSNDLKFQEAMESICILLQKDRMDAVLLGMESLSYLTNGESSNKQITLQAANTIVQNGPWQVAKDCIFNLICNQDRDDIEENNKLSQLQVKNKQKTKRLALKILANSLSTMINHDSQGTNVILNDQMNQWEEVLVLLISQMKCVHEGMQDNFHAAQCIEFLILSSEEMKVSAMNSL